MVIGEELSFRGAHRELAAALCELVKRNTYLLRPLLYICPKSHIDIANYTLIVRA